MVLGQAEVLRNLKNALKIVSKDVEQALEETGQRGVGIAKNNTPTVTGRLKNSMGYTVGNKTVGNSDSVNAIGEKNVVAIGTNVIYARRVEFLAKNGSQGYMLRSYNQLKPIAKQIFKTVLGRGIR